MFEIGFSEIILVAIVALVVFGPDKLPGLARDIGLWTGRIRRMVSSVQQDVQRELSRADELKRLIEEQENILDRHIILDDSAPTVPVTGKVAPPAPAEISPQAALPTHVVANESSTVPPAAAPLNPEPLPEQHALPLGTPVDVKTNQAN